MNCKDLLTTVQFIILRSTVHISITDTVNRQTSPVRAFEFFSSAFIDVICRNSTAQIQEKNLTNIDIVS